MKYNNVRRDFIGRRKNRSGKQNISLISLCIYPSESDSK